MKESRLSKIKMSNWALVHRSEAEDKSLFDGVDHAVWRTDFGRAHASMRDF